MEKEERGVVEQLSNINEQLEIRNRRSKKIWQIVGIVFAVILAFNLLLVVLNFAAYSSYTSMDNVTIEKVQ